MNGSYYKVKLCQQLIIEIAGTVKERVGNNNIEILLLTGWAEPGAIGFAATGKMPGHLVVPMDMNMTDQAITASEKFEKKEILFSFFFFWFFYF